jgi:hypothetical protein
LILHDLKGEDCADVLGCWVVGETVQVG